MWVYDILEEIDYLIEGVQDMITGELKNKIDSLWEIFWTGGLTNPLDVIEQMTYLMFIHDLDETDNTRAKCHAGTAAQQYFCRGSADR